MVAVLNLLLLVAVFAMGLRRGAHALTADELHHAERRLLQSLEQNRGANEAGLRQLQLAAETGRTAQTNAVLTTLDRGFDEGLAAQDARLARLDDAVSGLAQVQAERTQVLMAELQAARSEQHALMLRLGGDLTTRQAESAGQLRAALSTEVNTLGDRLLERAETLRSTVDARLGELRADNTEKLEKMRATVEEKLQSTLETRLGESFRTVSQQLEKVHQGLGEMQSLATGVGDLKRVLTNVKSRGTFGETQLSALLEDLLAPEQFEASVVTRAGTDERVDFVVKLPGPELGGPPVLLPIDAKFPLEDYLRLQAAQDEGDAVAVLTAQEGLRQRLVMEARSIAEKYVSAPHTTEFGLLYLCTEGLYAEALRLDGLVESLSRTHHVTVVGPTTLAAFLSSLRVGFRTLAIQRRSGEVWQVLGAVKTEFAKFGTALDGVSKKLQEATHKVDALTVRRRAVERTLREVEQLPEGEVAARVPALGDHVS